MKKQLLLLSAFLVLFIVSCKKDVLEEAQPVSQSFQLSFATESADLGLPFANTELTLTNKANGLILKAKADAKGLVNFSSVTPGNYSIVASLLVTAAEYSQISGAYTAEDVSFNASLEANIVSGTAVLPLTLKSGRLGNWVIKQIYYGGSSTTQAALFRDQFVELFNNSNEVLYADGLCISQVHGKNTRTSSVDITKPYYLPNGQFNWLKAIGMTGTTANTDYVYGVTLFKIPGSGTQYPVQPGSSIIIAQNAQNHKSAYVGADGAAISVRDPSLTIDLSKADFEVYYGNIAGVNPLSSDVDNPTIPNVNVLLTGYIRDMILNNNGYEALVIYKPATDPLAWPKFPDPEEVTLTSASKLYLQIPTSAIIDGVDLMHTVASSRAAKRLPDAIDAGFTFTAAGAYSSQSVIRKTSKTLAGRKVLKDTNNSTQDFDYLTLADATKTVFK